MRHTHKKRKVIESKSWVRKKLTTLYEIKRQEEHAGEAGGGTVVHSVWYTTPISARAKQIKQIPTVLHQVLSLSFSSLISMRKKIKNLSTQIKQKEPNTHVKQKWLRWKVHSCILPSCGSATKWQRSGLREVKWREPVPLCGFSMAASSILPSAVSPAGQEANPRPIRLQGQRAWRWCVLQRGSTISVSVAENLQPHSDLPSP